MKALLIIIIMVDGGAFVQPMPTMEGCKAAAHEIEIRRNREGRDGRAVMAICAENR